MQTARCFPSAGDVIIIAVSPNDRGLASFRAYLAGTVGGIASDIWAELVSEVLLCSVADLTLGLCQRLRAGEGVMENATFRLHFYIVSGPFTLDLGRISTSWNWPQTFKSWQWWALLWQSGDQLATSWQAANPLFPLPDFDCFPAVSPLFLPLQNGTSC